jgi:hypothetical protein
MRWFAKILCSPFFQAVRSESIGRKRVHPPDKNINLGEVAHLPLCIVASPLFCEKSLAKVAVSFALMQKKEERKIAASSESPHVRQCQASFSLLSLNRAFQDYGSRWRTSRRSAKSSELASLKQQSFLNASLLLPFAVEPKVDHSFLRNDAVAKIAISNNFLEP